MAGGIVLPLVTTIHGYSLGGAAFEGMLSGAPTNVGRAWQTENTATFVPLYLPETTTAVKLFWLNGDAVSGNVDIGIYTEDGALLTSAGTTAQAGISVIQEVDIPDIELTGPRRYYFAFVMSVAAPSTSSKVSTARLGDPIAARMFGMAEQTSALPLPATATLTTYAQSQGDVPIVGFSKRALVA